MKVLSHYSIKLNARNKFLPSKFRLILERINPLTPRRTHGVPFQQNFNSILRRYHQKNFLWASRLWVGRRKEPILGWVQKNDIKKLVHKGLICDCVCKIHSMVSTMNVKTNLYVLKIFHKYQFPIYQYECQSLKREIMILYHEIMIYQLTLYCLACQYMTQIAKILILM